MIINFHEHPNKWVEENMRENKIDKSVLLSVGVDAVECAHKMAKESPSKYIPFFWIEMEDISISVQELEKTVKEFNFKGVKFQPLTQHFFPDERKMYPIYEKCVELNIPITFHTGIVALGYKIELGRPFINKYGDTIFGIDRVAYDFPNLKIVIAHMGGNFFYKALVTAEKHENIFMDTAFLPFFCKRMLPEITPLQMIKKAIQIIGAKRILYGYEGFPPSVIIESDIKEEDKEAILSENAKRVLHL